MGKRQEEMELFCSRVGIKMEANGRRRAAAEYTPPRLREKNWARKVRLFFCLFGSLVNEVIHQNILGVDRGLTQHREERTRLIPE